MTSFSLPPVLPSSPAYDHKEDETPQVELGRVTTPAETPIFICALESCNRLFPSRDRLAQHRKVAHPGTDAHTDVLTWNEDPAPPTA
ncbi:hypothetical protein EXIGLDRAFT_835484 [Exidia glandulosa HHB12029]|uniref:C2H2-type domain-containing protein n=1 Tax=Exidia glandulosa HHB12029 TaxID=1314781 RepID=A0A165IRP0_EXIGL|nr:hypothetical protein EXIGLDRAFT_835484 [Exidia glandulosa HHB12029]